MFPEVTLIEKEYALNHPGYEPQPRELVELMVGTPIEDLRLTLQSYNILRTRV